MDLDLNTFNKEMTNDERKAKTIIGKIQLKGPIANDDELTKSFLEMMNLIFEHYEFDYDCVLKLKNDNCKKCNKKLIRKGEFRKEINLPGGSSIILDFYRYSCSDCKTPVDRELSKVFEPNKQYSKNIKSDAVRLYSKQLSSYELIAEEINKIYCKNISKKTIMSWLTEIGLKSEKVLHNDNDFSGYILYDEEFTKVFNGNVGVKGASLEWVDHYLLLFRDAITGKTIIKFADNLKQETLLSIWKEVFIHLTKMGIEIKAFGTDGKREYKNYIKILNKELSLNIQHVYDAFHFSKNLYESANEEIFGIKQTKKKLPDLILKQIKMIEDFFNSKTLIDAQNKLNQLIFEKEYFIKGLKQHIFRLKNNFKDYTYFLEVPEMKTTNLCEGWFSRTKPKKLKREYKTREGIKAIANMIAVRINYNWKKELDLNFDVSLALDASLGLIKSKYQ
jgi:hypothetical protein